MSDEPGVDTKNSDTPAADGAGGVKDTINRYFKIAERGSSFSGEIRGGLVTFFAMAYIVVLNPIIIGGVAGQPLNADVDGNVLPTTQVAAVTALVAGVMTILFGLIAKMPFAIAAGLGINSMLAVTIIPHMSWPAAMGLVVIDGIIIVILGVTGFRTAVFNAVPAELKSAIAAGIGAFIAFIGFVNAGFVGRTPFGPPVQLGSDGSLNTIPVLVFVIGVLLMGALVVRKVRGALLIGIITMTIVSAIIEAIWKIGAASDTNPGGWKMNVPGLPDSLGGIPDLSLVGQVSIVGGFEQAGVVIAMAFVFTLLLANFFDAMGTMTGVGKEAGLTDEKGNLPGIGKALVIEGTGAVVGGAGSASSNTVFVDSSAGVAEGARTGLANVVTGALFLLAMFFTPLYEIVPMEAVTPALVVVGAMMMGQVSTIDFTRFEYALPAFLTIVIMPFTYSIANGIGAGFISWVILAAARGKAREVHPLLWVVAGLFVIYFAHGPIEDLFS